MEPFVLGYFGIGALLSAGFCLWMWYMGGAPDPQGTFIDSLKSYAIYFILFVIVLVFWPALFFIER